MKKYFTTAIITLFLAITACIFLLKNFAPEFRWQMLEYGNFLVAAITLMAYQIVIYQTRKSPQAFIRGVMGGTMLKMLICLAAIMVYILMNRGDIHKPSIFIMMGIYALYLIAETLLLLKIVSTKP